MTLEIPKNVEFRGSAELLLVWCKHNYIDETNQEGYVGLTWPDARVDNQQSAFVVDVIFIEGKPMVKCPNLIEGRCSCLF